MEALSAFPRSYLEEIMLTVLILSNLANVSGYPLKKKRRTKYTQKYFVFFVCGNTWLY